MSDMFPSGEILALIETLTPQHHQDLIDIDSSDSSSVDAATASRKKYSSIIQERIADETRGLYVLTGHVQQLVQKLQRSPFFGIVVPVCAMLQSKVVGKDSYEKDLLPFLNPSQRKDFAVFMKRIRDTRAQHAAAVELLRNHLEGQKISLVVRTMCCCLLQPLPHCSHPALLQATKNQRKYDSCCKCNS